MEIRHLFLFGGSPPFGEKLGRKFANLSFKEKGRVAILFIERDGWKGYMPKYTKVLESNGLNNFIYLPLSPSLSDNDITQLNSCTGIIICGGETEIYRNYIVDTPIAKHIKELYKNGVPIAGFSAGALITPEVCVIPPIDNLEKNHLFLDGLGLINDCVVSVHFSKWNEEDNLKMALSKTKASIGYGIDDDTGVYFVNDKFLTDEGGKVYTFSENKPFEV